MPGVIAFYSIETCKLDSAQKETFMHKLGYCLPITFVAVVLLLTVSKTIADEPEKNSSGDWIDPGDITYSLPVVSRGNYFAGI